MSDREIHQTVKLVVLRGSAQGKSFPIEEGENLIGRWDPDAGAFPEIDLDTEDLEAKVSRKHAIIQCSGGEIYITDIGSRNGTFINRGPRLKEGEKHALKSGDEIIIGKTFLRLIAE